MTSYHEVHLFAWMKENAVIIGSFLAVIWAMMVFWFKTITNNYLTRSDADLIITNKIESCKNLVDKRDDDLEKEQQEIVKTLKDMDKKLDHIDDRRRSDAVENSKEHHNIMTQLLKIVKQ